MYEQTVMEQIVFAVPTLSADIPAGPGGPATPPSTITSVSRPLLVFFSTTARFEELKLTCPEPVDTMQLCEG